MGASSLSQPDSQPGAGLIAALSFHSEALQKALVALDTGESPVGFAVALSGGADSLALLIALAECVAADRILALHFDHGIHPDSASWSRHCRDICNRRQIAFLTTCWIESDSQLKQRESAARDARYDWFARVLPEKYVLLTGHHLDDQAETVLMNLAEGRSLARVAGIPVERPLRYGDSRRVFRPLLGFRRDELQAFLNQKEVEWVEDPANLDNQHSRNLLRQEIMPVLVKRWPVAARSISRFAGQLSETLAMVDDMAEDFLIVCSEPDQKTLYCKTSPLRLKPLLSVSEIRFNIVIRNWVHQGRASSPGRRQLAEFYRQLLSVSSESHVQMRVDGGEVIYFDGHLFLIAPLHFMLGEALNMTLDQDVICPGLQVAYDPKPEGVATSHLHSGELKWRMRQTGDRFVVSKRSGSATLKKVMQGLKLAPWLRQSLPVLACDKDVVWAHGVGVNARYQQGEGELACVVPRFCTYPKG